MGGSCSSGCDYWGTAVSPSLFLGWRRFYCTSDPHLPATSATKGTNPDKYIYTFFKQINVNKYNQVFTKHQRNVLECV